MEPFVVKYCFDRDVKEAKRSFNRVEEFENLANCESSYLCLPQAQTLWAPAHGWIIS